VSGGGLAEDRPRVAPGWLERRTRAAVLARLAGLHDGVLTVRESGEILRFGRPVADGLRAGIEVLDPAAWSDIAFGGTVGAGEAWVDGTWTTDDLPALVRLMVRNRDVLEGLDGGLARLRAAALRGMHRLRRNTRPGSRRNIAGHYDLGNELFVRMLDPTLMYSCAVFEDGDSLEDASRRKLDRICAKLDLAPGDEVVEIGTGWGGFAIHAAGEYGAKVTTTTISEEQFRLAGERVRAAGLSDRVTLLRHDYRDLPRTLGRAFPKAVSIEMIEAVGLRYLDRYFRVCRDLLEPGGRMLLQAITIADDLFESYRRSVDFIQRYVFPGGALPSMGAMRRSIARVGDLDVAAVEDLTPHYVETLRRWRDNFRGHLREIRDLGYSERFVRMWEFYLGYCEGGFAERSIGDVQVLLARAPRTETRG